MSSVEFLPPRQRGLVIHSLLILVLGIFSAGSAWRAFESNISLTLTIFILIAIATFFPLPFLAYRLYALARGNYRLSRDSLRLQWGLRLEEIPVSDVEWVRSVFDLTSHLPLPWFRLPGAILGTRRHPDLGPVEFMASEEKNLLLVATARRIFAISPENPAVFVQNFQRAVEMGSLSPAPAQSLYPSFIVAQAWTNLLVRYLWLVILFLNIGLLAWVSLIIPRLGSIPLVFSASGAPLDPVPGVRLILLPIVSIFFSLLGWVSGLYFYRREQERSLALITWASSALSALLFLIAVLFIITTPV